MSGFFASALPGKGSFALIALKTLSGAAIVAPMAAAAVAKTGELANNPLFADAARPWPGFQSLGAAINGFQGAAGALPLAIALGFTFKFFLDGAASRWFAMRAAGEEGGFWRTLFSAGWDRWWAMFRVAIVSALLVAAGVAGLGAATALLADPQTALDNLETTQGLAIAAVAWGLVVGAISTWMKADLGARNGKSAIASFGLGLSGLVRRPFAGLIFFVLAAGFALHAGSALLLWLRVAEPVPVTTGVVWAAVSGGLLLQAFVWHWTLRYAAGQRVKQRG